MDGGYGHARSPHDDCSLEPDAVYRCESLFVDETFGVRSFKQSQNVPESQIKHAI